MSSVLSLLWSFVCGVGGLYVDDIVGAHPGGRAYGQAGLGAGRELARRLDVAAHEGGLRGGEIGLGEIALAAIGHGELGIGIGRFGFATERRVQKRDLSLIHISEPTRRTPISYAVFCL